MLRASEHKSALWVVTTYFNPAGFRLRRENYRRFRSALGQKPCLTIECALSDRPFELTAADDVLQVRARDSLWHKERLVNLALATLPPDCRYVAWIDGDVLFERPDWDEQTQALLERHVAVQPWSEVVLLPSPNQPTAQPELVRGMAATIAEHPAALTTGRFADHGHCGYAWAARRELLDAVGLYDACIAGSADHVMAHGMLVAPHAPCVTRLLGDGTPHHRHFCAWSQRLREVCSDLGLSGLGYLPGRITHLWHGELADRRYLERNLTLQRLGFDPVRDLWARPGEPWRLSEPNSELGRFLTDYFPLRREDG